MRKLKGILVLVLLLALLTSPAVILASDISGAQYYGTIIISNNSTAATNVAVNCTISTPALIDGGYLNSSANNCVVRSSAGADLPFMPGCNSTLPWCIWVPSIGQNSHLSDILYTANSTGGEIRYFPATGGMTSTDSASLELGDNFTIEQKGWVDTAYSANKTLVLKEDAFQTYISGSENITSSILSLWTNPTGDAGDWTNPTQAYNDNTGNYATKLTPDTGWTTFIELTHDGVLIDRIRYYASGDFSIDLIDVDYYDGNWEHLYQGSFTWNTWEIKTLAEPKLVTKARVRMNNPTSPAHNARLHDFDFGKVVTITAASISSEEYTVKTSGSPAFLGLGVDIGDDTTYPVVTDNLVLNTPLWSPYLSSSPFDSVDANAYSCTVTGATWTSGGYSLDGDDDYISIPFTSTDNSGSIEFWAYLTGTSTAETIFSWSKPSTAFTAVLRIQLDGTNKSLTYYHRNVAASFLSMHSGTNSMTLDAWHHFAVTSDDSTLRVYIDGVYKAFTIVSGANDGRWFGDLVTEPPDHIILGAEARSDVYISDYEGLIGEVRVYDSDLSQAEVTLNFNATRWKYIGDHTDDDFDYVYSGVSVPNNSENWTFLQNNAMPYMEYQTISVNSTQVQGIDWEYDDTTFQDSTAFDNDAAPTFRTTSSDADVSAVLSSFLPVQEAKAPAYALTDAPAFIETVPTIVSQWDITPVAGTFPLATVIAAIANATGTPAQLPLLIIAGFVILACSLSISYTMRKYGSGSLIVKIIVITAVMGVFIALKNFGIEFWMLVVFLVIAIALAMGSKQVGWQ